MPDAALLRECADAAAMHAPLTLVHMATPLLGCWTAELLFYESVVCIKCGCLPSGVLCMRLPPKVPFRADKWQKTSISLLITLLSIQPWTA